MTKPIDPKHPTKTGPKIKLSTPEIREKFIAACRLDASVPACCAYAGITTPTYYAYIKENPEFLAEIEVARQEPYLKAVNTIVKSLDDPKIAIKYLERKHRKEYATRTELTGGDGEDYGIKVEFVNGVEPTQDNTTSGV